jgi:hypothetical protein
MLDQETIDNQIRLLTSHRPDTYGLCAVPVFLKCCLPLRLSAPGYSDDPKNSLHFLTPCRSNIAVRDTAHHLTFQHFESRVLTVDFSVAPFETKRGSHGSIILFETSCKAIVLRRRPGINELVVMCEHQQPPYSSNQCSPRVYFASAS